MSNRFWFYVLDVVEVPAAPGSGKQAEQTVYLSPEDFAAVAQLAPDELKDVNLVVYDSKERQIAITRTEPHRSISFDRNIIVWKTGPALSDAWGKTQTVSGGNCWFNSAGAPIEFMGKPLAEWQKAGHETGFITPIRCSRIPPTATSG